MSKAHDHLHDHGGDGTNERRLAITLVLVLLYMAVEVVGGLWADSLVLIADAGHMFSDAGALGLTLLAMQFARAVVYMAGLPLDVNVQFITVMATKMPFIGRG